MCVCRYVLRPGQKVSATVSQRQQLPTQISYQHHIQIKD